MIDPLVPSRNEDQLRGFERLAVPAMTWWNHSAVGDHFVRCFLRSVSQPWIQAAMHNRLQVDGDQHLTALDLDSPRGLLIVGNHRTYYDLYVAVSVLVQRRGWYFDRMVFPVRSKFFYDHPMGVLTNFAVSAGSMWPPMFAGFGRQGLNARGLDQVVEVLHRPRCIAGLHPEGTRNKTDDPLQLGTAKGGVGRVVQALDPEVVVLPFFLSGISDNLLTEIRLNYRPEGHRVPPVSLSFGPGVRAGDLDREGRPVEVARRLMQSIRALGEAQGARDG